MKRTLLLKVQHSKRYAYKSGDIKEDTFYTIQAKTKEQDVHFVFRLQGVHQSLMLLLQTVVCNKMLHTKWG